MSLALLACSSAAAAPGGEDEMLLRVQRDRHADPEVIGGGGARIDNGLVHFVAPAKCVGEGERPWPADEERRGSRQPPQLTGCMRKIEIPVR
jgi:hypothetical protein